MFFCYNFQIILSAKDATQAMTADLRAAFLFIIIPHLFLGSHRKSKIPLLAFTPGFSRFFQSPAPYETLPDS